MDISDGAIVDRVFFFRRACRVSTVSSLALLVYDYIITFPEEINLVWKSPRSHARTIFYLNRYFALSFVTSYAILQFYPHPTFALCKAEFNLQAWSNWAGSMLVELFLQFWVVSVYQPSKRTRICMASLYVVLAISSATALSVVLRKVNIDLEMPGCALAASHNQTQVMDLLLAAAQPRIPVSMFSCMLPCVIYELVLLALIVRRAIQFFRASGRSGLRKNPVASVLIRDSVTYFIVILAAYIANALIWTFAPSQLFQIGVGFGVALPAILGSRLLLNLRGAHRRAHQFTPTVELSHTTRWDYLLASSSATLAGASTSEGASAAGGEVEGGSEEAPSADGSTMMILDAEHG